MIPASWQDSPGTAGAQGSLKSAPQCSSGNVSEHRERIDAWAFTPLVVASELGSDGADAHPSSHDAAWALDPYAVGAAAVGAALIALAIFGG